MLKYSVYAWWGWLSSDHISAFRMQSLLWSATQSDQVHLLFLGYELARDFPCISSGGGKRGKAGTVTIGKRIASCSPGDLSKRSKQKGSELRQKKCGNSVLQCVDRIFSALCAPLMIPGHFGTQSLLCRHRTRGHIHNITVYPVLTL